MNYAVVGEIVSVAADDILGVIIFNSQKRTELALDNRTVRKQICNLNIDFVAPLHTDKVDFILANPAYIYFISARQHFDIHDIFVQLIIVDNVRTFYVIPQPKVGGIIFFACGKQCFALQIIARCGLHHHCILYRANIIHKRRHGSPYPLAFEFIAYRICRKGIAHVFKQESYKTAQQLDIAYLISRNYVFDYNCIEYVVEISAHRLLVV